jgi:hypothetical protein
MHDMQFIVLDLYRRELVTDPYDMQDIVWLFRKATIAFIAAKSFGYNVCVHASVQCSSLQCVIHICCCCCTSVATTHLGCTNATNHRPAVMYCIQVLEIVTRKVRYCCLIVCVSCKENRRRSSKGDTKLLRPTRCHIW